MRLEFDSREDYLAFRKAEINKLDKKYSLNELELIGVRPGDTVYVSYKRLSYACVVESFTKRRCTVRIIDEGKLNGRSLKLAFNRIHQHPSEINH